MELPPRARRIQGRTYDSRANSGTTSACAENTAVLFLIPAASRNYLRVRGEYVTTLEERLDRMELPPRARRIPPIRPEAPFCKRTTSACAENTDVAHMPKNYMRNYLRVRGEYIVPRRSTTISWELPPRARRILTACPPPLSGFGTTSACAENTRHVGL